MDARIEGSLLSGLLHALLHELLCLRVHLLDARRMDAPVGDEVLERDACGLAANGIEARKDDGLGGVIDDERDT